MQRTVYEKDNQWLLDLLVRSISPYGACLCDDRGIYCRSLPELLFLLVNGIA